MIGRRPNRWHAARKLVISATWIHVTRSGSSAEYGRPSGAMPLDPAVDPADLLDGVLGLLDGAERRVADERRGPPQPAERVVAVVRVIGDAGHGEGMETLEQ